MTFNREDELDPRLSGIALVALHGKFEQEFAGHELAAAMKNSEISEDAKTATRLEKALKAAFADLETLVETVAADGNEDIPGEVENDKLLLEIYWRLHDGWKAEAAPVLKMVDVSGTAPAWTDVVALFTELSSMDQEAPDGEAVPAEWYEELLARYESRLGKSKPKKAAPKKALPPIKEPPPDAEIADYSTKSTFSVGQWVRHPKFGVGIVVEAAQHVTVEIGHDRKILAHVPAVTPPPQPKQRPRKPMGNTLELARAAGVDIKKMPARFEEEK